MAAEVSVVVLVFDEEESLPRLLQLIREQDLSRVQFVMVDNGSSDGSAALLAASGLEVVSLPVNRGFGGGVQAGLSRCSAPAVVWMPGNLRVLPADAVAVGLLCRQFALPVKARRVGRPLSDALFSRAASLLFSLAARRSVPEVGSTPTAVPARLVPLLRQGPSGLEFEAWSWLLLRASGLPVLRPSVRFLPRSHGASRWRTSPLSGLQLLLRLCRSAPGWRRSLDPR